MTETRADYTTKLGTNGRVRIATLPVINLPGIAVIDPRIKAWADKIASGELDAIDGARVLNDVMDAHVTSTVRGLLGLHLDARMSPSDDADDVIVERAADVARAWRAFDERDDNFTTLTLYQRLRMLAAAVDVKEARELVAGDSDNPGDLP
jgi:hypothetical protein